MPATSIHPARFDPDVVVAINEAYRRALILVGSDSAHGDKRAGLARCIMELAETGEHDTDRLCDRATAAFRRQYPVDRVTPC